MLNALFLTKNPSRFGGCLLLLQVAVGHEKGKRERKTWLIKTFFPFGCDVLGGTEREGYVSREGIGGEKILTRRRDNVRWLSGWRGSRWKEKKKNKGELAVDEETGCRSPLISFPTPPPLPLHRRLTTTPTWERDAVDCELSLFSFVICRPLSLGRLCCTQGGMRRVHGTTVHRGKISGQEWRHVVIASWPCFPHWEEKEENNNNSTPSLSVPTPVLLYFLY